MNPSNRLSKASNLTNQRPEFLESYIRIFDSFDSSFIQKIRKIQLQLPALLLTLLGIYGCTNPTTIQRPGTVRYKIVSISAVSEWILSLFWLTFILSIAHDIWFLIDVREIFFQHQGYKSVQGGESDNELQHLRRPTSLVEISSLSESLSGDYNSLSYSSNPRVWLKNRSGIELQDGIEEV